MNKYAEPTQNFRFAAGKNCIVFNHLISSYCFENRQFNIYKVYVLLSTFCFVWISEQTAIISLYSIN
jgi:hypothetical protein